MSEEALENLARIEQLKREAPDVHEFNGLLRSGRTRLKDAEFPGLSLEGRSISLTTPRMPWPWRLCVGTAIVPAAATTYFSV